MKLKEDVLKRLEESRGISVSGEEMAEELSVTRAAIWKAINSLRDEGFDIKAVKNSGYMLSSTDDRLSREGIETGLRAAGFTGVCKIEVYDSVDSTQNVGKKLVSEHPLSHALITANSQTNGRGRYGKNFYSPKDTGIYMSLCIRVEKPIENFLSITFATAVAVSRVIERHSKKKAEIKWVNDIWIDGRKSTGILTEAVSDMESGMLGYVVIGIGMNLKTRDFPDDVKDIAFSIDDMDICRSRLIGEIAAEVFEVAKDPDSLEIYEEYKSRSLVLGKKIWWMENGQKKAGTATDINRAGNLIVDTDEGVSVLNSGEVSIRPL